MALNSPSTLAEIFQWGFWLLLLAGIAETLRRVKKIEKKALEDCPKCKEEIKEGFFKALHGHSHTGLPPDSKVVREA